MNLALVKSLTTDSSHLAPNEVLSTIFASAARVAVLRVLLIDPTRPYYQRQLETACKLPIRAIQRELDRLTKIGLLYRHVEGNRAYYRVDPDFSLYPELRRLILKAVDAEDLLRSSLVTLPAVRQAFLSFDKESVLVVTHGSATLEIEGPQSIGITAMSSEAFLELVRAKAEPVHQFLSKGTDLLGRRDDLIWRHIEAAGYTVNKGDGVT